MELVLILSILVGIQKKILVVLSLVIVLKQKLNKHINRKSQTNRDQKLNLLFLQRHDQSQTFWLKLVKNKQKALDKKNWWLWKKLHCKSFVFAY